MHCQKYTYTVLNIDGTSNTCTCKCKDGVWWLTIFCLITGSDCQNYKDEEEDNQCSLANRTCRNIAQYVPTFQKTNQRANWVAHRAQIHEERWGKHKHVHLHGLNCDTVFRNSRKCRIYCGAHGGTTMQQSSTIVCCVLCCIYAAVDEVFQRKQVSCFWSYSMCSLAQSSDFIHLIFISRHLSSQ